MLRMAVSESSETQPKMLSGDDGGHSRTLLTYSRLPTSNVRHLTLPRSLACRESCRFRLARPAAGRSFGFWASRLDILIGCACILPNQIILVRSIWPRSIRLDFRRKSVVRQLDQVAECDLSLSASNGAKPPAESKALRSSRSLKVGLMFSLLFLVTFDIHVPPPSD